MRFQSAFALQATLEKTHGRLATLELEKQRADADGPDPVEIAAIERIQQILLETIAGIEERLKHIH